MPSPGAENSGFETRNCRGSGGVSLYHVGRQVVAGEKNKVSSTMVQQTLTRSPSDQAPLIPPQPLGLDVQAHLGRQLRAVFDDMARQPVPDKFAELLDALERKTAGAGAEAAAPAAGSTVTGSKAGDA
jgi:hypothetical protein